MATEILIQREPPPERVRTFLQNQGWYMTGSNLWMRNNSYEALEWSEALLMEMMDFIEAMHK